MQNTEIYSMDVDDVLLKYSDMVYKIALTQTKNKNDADDVFQEVFLRLVMHAENITSEEHMKAWLIRVTINCCKKHYKRWKTRDLALSDDVFYITPEKHEVYYAVLSLPRKYRLVIHLFYYEELSVREISHALNTKESTVKSQLSRGRSMLKEMLKGGFGDIAW